MKPSLWGWRWMEWLAMDPLVLPNLLAVVVVAARVAEVVVLVGVAVVAVG